MPNRADRPPAISWLAPPPSSAALPVCRSDDRARTPSRPGWSRAGSSSTTRLHQCAGQPRWSADRLCRAGRRRQQSVGGPRGTIRPRLAGHPASTDRNIGS